MRFLPRPLALLIPAAMFLLFPVNAQAPADAAQPKPPAAADRKTQKPEFDRNQDKNMPAWKELMTSLTEDEKTDLKKLQEKSPEAFRDAIKQKLQNIKAKKQEENSKLTELVKKYNETQGSAEKNQLQRQIKELCEKQFDERMEGNRKSIEHVEQRLNELKKKYQDRLSKKNDIIEQRIKDLTKDPSLEW